MALHFTAVSPGSVESERGIEAFSTQKLNNESALMKLDTLQGIFRHLKLKLEMT